MNGRRPPIVGHSCPGTGRVFLTAMVDPYGQRLAFTWDGQVRLVAVTDALGQVTSSSTTIPTR